MINTIKKYLHKNDIDAWLIYDYELNNPAFVRLFGKSFITRKVFVLISLKECIVLCHSIDRPLIEKSNNARNFVFITYNTWIQLQNILENMLKGYRKIMMEISEDGMLPKMSCVDYGTVCLIKRFVDDIVSSADLFQMLTATFSGKPLELHKKAALIIDNIKDRAFNLISKKISANELINEYDVQEFILHEFKINNMITDGLPIVAVNANAGNPHYEPTKSNSVTIKKGDLVLIDLWAKLNVEDSVFADITWIGYVGKKVPNKILKAFDTVKLAIDTALKYLNENLPLRKICGYEIDDVCSRVLIDNGYKDFILHRTGHSMSLGDSDHGVGVNIDNFETHDTRAIINNIAFSLEPGIYNEEFGIREEIDVYIENNKAKVFTKRQNSILLL